MLRLFFSALLLLTCVAPVFGQTFGTGGGFGQTNTGFGASTSNPFGQTGLGQSGLGQSGLGQSGLGQSGLGQSGLGQSGLGQIGFGTTVALDPTFGTTQFSNSLATAAAVNRVTSALGGRGFGGNFGGGRGGFGGFGGQNNNQQKPQVRAVLRIGFPVEARESSAVGQSVNARLARMPQSKNLQNVQVTMQGRTAVIRGEVESAEDGKLVERLLSLEPGIDAIKNELTIAGQPAPSQSDASVEVVPLPK